MQHKKIKKVFPPATLPPGWKAGPSSKPLAIVAPPPNSYPAVAPPTGQITLHNLGESKGPIANGVAEPDGLQMREQVQLTAPSTGPPASSLDAVIPNKVPGKKERAPLPVPADLANIGFLRLEQVLQLLPMSRASWYQGIADGRHPKPVKIGMRSVAWSRAAIVKLIEDLNAESAASVGPFDLS